MTSLPRVLLVGDQHTGSSPAVPNRPGCIICQAQTGPNSDWCPDHLEELRTPPEDMVALVAHITAGHDGNP